MLLVANLANTNQYSYESTQLELFNEYCQHDRV